MGLVHLLRGGGADLQGGPMFFSNAEKQENKRDQGGQQFSRGGPAPVGPPDPMGRAAMHGLGLT